MAVGIDGYQYWAGGFIGGATLNERYADLADTITTRAVVIPAAIAYTSGAEGSQVGITYTIQIQFDELSDGNFSNVTTQAGSVGSGVEAGTGKVAYWTSTEVDKDGVDATIDVRVTAELD